MSKVRHLGGPGLLASDAGQVDEKAGAGTADSEENAYRESIRLWFLIYDVSRLHRSTFDGFMKPLSITRTEWAVLAELSRRDGMTQTQLAKNVDMPKAGVGAAIDRLERSGWLMRGPDPEDRRARRVYLVASAKTVIRKMSRTAGKFSERILVDLTPEERLTLTTALLKVKSAIFQRRPATAAEAEELKL